MSANLDKNFKNKKLIAKLFLELSENPKIKESYFDNKFNSYVAINDFTISFNSNNEFSDLFDIEKIVDVFFYDENHNEFEVLLNEKQKIQLAIIFEKIIKTQLDFKENYKEVDTYERGCDLYHQLKDEAVC